MNLQIERERSCRTRSQTLNDQMERRNKIFFQSYALSKGLKQTERTEERKHTFQQPTTKKRKTHEKTNNIHIKFSIDLFIFSFFFLSSLSRVTRPDELKIIRKGEKGG